MTTTMARPKKSVLILSTYEGIVENYIIRVSTSNATFDAIRAKVLTRGLDLFEQLYTYTVLGPSNELSFSEHNEITNFQKFVIHLKS